MVTRKAERGPISARALANACALPKADLHLHFEGAVPSAFFSAIDSEFMPAPNIGSFESFVGEWRKRTRYLDSRTRIEQAAALVARQLKASNVTYAEMHVSTAGYERHHGLRLSDVLIPLRAGLSRQRGLQVGIIVDLIRDYGAEVGQRTLDQLLELRHDLDIVAIGLGGRERPDSLKSYASIFEQARSQGIGAVCHTGEQSSYRDVLDCLNFLPVSRIGHAVHAASQPTLLKQIAERQIAIEVCLTSNHITGATLNFDPHPIKQFLNYGITCTIGTDDPGIFDSDLNGEIISLIDMGFSVEETIGILRAGFAASFAGDAAKTKLLKRFDTLAADKCGASRPKVPDDLH